MEGTDSSLHRDAQPASVCCGRCGCPPTGGDMRRSSSSRRRSLIPGRSPCSRDMATIYRIKVQEGVGGSRSWSRIAAWSLMLLTLLNTATRTTQQTTTTTEPPVTPRACYPVFTANSSTHVFKGACEDISVFPCNYPLTSLQTVNPSDCSRRFTCGNFMVFNCPCPPGLMWNNTQGDCVRSFYANCTCPDGRGPPKPTTTPIPLQGDNTALIAGVVVGVVVIIILIVVIVLLMKRRQAQLARPMTPSLGPQLSSKSMNYEDITDLKRGEDPNIYDNGPTFDTAVYDNHGFGDRDAIRPRTENATVKSTTSTVSTPPPLPGGHPTSMKSMANGVAEEEPEYMETLE